jgi:hypothetical protein
VVDKNKYLLYTIALYQIIGAILGLVDVIQNFITYELWQDNDYLLLAIFLILVYLFFLLSGIYIFINSKIGIRLSIISQSIQVLYVNILGLVFLITSTARFIIYMGSQFNIGFAFRVGSYFEIAYYDGQQNIEFGINIIPVVIILLLISKFNTKKEDNKT